MTGVEKTESMTLFGGDEGWQADDWTASDDRVRGGKSQSYLDFKDKTACFHGNLDIKTLGGAGFASQRTTSDDLGFDLHKYAGITLHLAKGDSQSPAPSSKRRSSSKLDLATDNRTIEKRYTFILKDEVLPKNSNDGRDQASISYECDFELPPQAEPGHSHDRTVFIPWESLNPTYRGKLKKDAKPLDRSKIKRVSIMMRSYFGTQEGDFSLELRSITAVPTAPSFADFTAGGKDPRQLEEGQGDDNEALIQTAGSHVQIGRSGHSMVRRLDNRAYRWKVNL
ncbi:hypothetical protein MBLNU230_g1149t2 [Neophaeotheca triangularis]